MIHDVKQYTDLVLRRHIKRKKAYTQFIVDQDFEFAYSKTGEPRRNVTVPAGFETDLSSVPKIARSVVSKVDLIEASVAHDYLYDSRIVPRKEADAVFLAFAKAYGDPWITRNIAWLAVRIFGGVAYDT